jgi:type I restriction enzyme S subunit
VKAAARWPSLSLPEAFWFQEGPGVRKWQFTTSGIKLLNVANIEKDGTLNLEKTERHLDEAEVAKKYSHFLVDAGDLVIASSGISFDDDGLLRTRGAFVRGKHLPLCLNTSTIRFKSIRGVSDLRFLRLWLNGREFRSQITKLVTGTAQQNFGPSHLKATTITLPPLAEQRRIAEVLDRGEALRAKRRATLAELDTLIQSFFFDCFGDLGRYNFVSLESLASSKRHSLSSGPFGSSLTSKDYVDEGTLVLRGLNVTGGEISFHDCKFVSESKARELARSLVSPMDIVIVAVGASGFACLIPNDFPRAVMSQNFNKISPNLELVDPRYLVFLLNSDFIQRQFFQNITDTVRTFLSLTKVRKVSIPLPPIDLQREFARRVTAVEKLKTAQRASLAELDALFATLQHRAFRGEL